MIIIICTSLISQEKDYSLAKVAEKKYGVYIFIGCTPANQYDYIATVKVKWHTDDPDMAFKEAIEKAKRKYQNFDGMIFKDKNYEEAELIKFVGSEITGGGFRTGQKVVRKDGRDLQYGEVSMLDNTKQRATIKYLDEYGDTKSTDVSYLKLSALNSEEYERAMAAQNIEIQKHKFSNGEKVTWADGNKLQYGEILSLNNDKHDAKINYLDKYGDTRTETVDFLKVEKADDSKYKEFKVIQDIEIQKHKFTTGESISFVDEKTTKVGEVTALNDQNHRASVKYLNIYGEEKTRDIPYFEMEKISKQKFKEERERYEQDILKYKFKLGEKVNWSKGGIIKKAEIIQCEIISLDDISHKALIKYNDKENKEIQTRADYLDLTKTN